MYGSDEKGFSVSDEPYKVNVGNQKDGRSPHFPSNFVVELADTQLAVIGPEVTLPNANRAFYRVVAVDAKGNRSGPSDYVAAPRPLIYTAPTPAAKVGQAWEYRAATIRSIGDLRCRMIGQNEYSAAFWNEEKPEWSLPEAPEWLTVDAASSLVRGTPPAPGEYRVTIRAAIADRGAQEQTFVLVAR